MGGLGFIYPLSHHSAWKLAGSREEGARHLKGSIKGGVGPREEILPPTLGLCLSAIVRAAGASSLLLAPFYHHLISAIPKRIPYQQQHLYQSNLTSNPPSSSPRCLDRRKEAAAVHSGAKTHPTFGALNHSPTNQLNLQLRRLCWTLWITGYCRG